VGLRRFGLRTAIATGVLVLTAAGGSITVWADDPGSDPGPSAQAQPSAESSPSASPTPTPVHLKTNPQPTSGVAGKTLLADAATLRDATAGQVVAFQLWGPDQPGCTGIPAFSTTSPPIDALQAGGGTPVLSDGVVARRAGLFQWTAQVLDGSTVLASTRCGANPVIVHKAVPHIETRSIFQVLQGTAVHDQATVSGLVSPDGTGTVTFRLYGPRDTSCKQQPFYTSAAIPLDRAGSAASGSTAPPEGNYQWRAVFSGDSNNQSVSSRCGNEKLEVRTTLTSGQTQALSDPQQALNTPQTGVAQLEGRAGGVLVITGLTVWLGALRRRDRLTGRR
jgi:hypothetical protein